MPRLALNFDLSAAVAAAAAGDAPGAVPGEVELIPAPDADGMVRGRDGRVFLFDQAAQDMVLQQFAARGVSLPIDINHSTELQAPTGGESPAAGWIESLALRNGALIGRVEWNARGRSALSGRDYRYLSPVFDYDPTTNRIARLTSAALINTPNLRLAALNSEGDPMRSNLLTAAIVGSLCLAAAATDDEIATAINALKTDRDTAKALNSQQPSLDRFVPRSDYDAAVVRATNAEQQLAANATAAHNATIDTEIAAALAAGKITPASESYHRASCGDAGGLDRFREFVKAAPVIAPESGLDKKQPAGLSTALNTDERAICEHTGISEADFIKARALAA